MRSFLGQLVISRLIAITVRSFVSGGKHFRISLYMYFIHLI